MERIEKELDIVTFLRKQMMTSIALKTLFTKAERFLIKNQNTFVLDTEDGNDSNSSENSEVSDFDCKRMYEEIPSSKYFKTLLESAKPRLVKSNLISQKRTTRRRINKANDTAIH